jgi:hypothetical protein
MITLEDVIAGFAYAGAAFPHYQVTREQVQVYYDCLNDLPIERQELLEAFKAAIKDSEFFPSVASIRAQFKSTPTPPAYQALEAPKSEKTADWAEIARRTLTEARLRGLAGDLSDFGAIIEES